MLDEPLLVDALVYCDMTTTPEGEQITAEERVADSWAAMGLTAS
ncbi:hypothetical protein YUYDRAFT_06806 [Streptomyces sp. ScaeMP-e48]|nr:hypothetical protein YUYDRAFT_06806 [Streptomyces sp. ScaeMP-e48]